MLMHYLLMYVRIHAHISVYIAPVEWEQKKAILVCTADGVRVSLFITLS